MPAEVGELARLSNVTLWRLEQRGRFPKRIKIASRKVAWRRADIEAWLADPEGWGDRHAAGGGA